MIGKRTLIVTAVLLLFGLGSSYFFFWGEGESPEMETVVAERVDLTQTVEETGKVVSRKRVDLSFEQPGTLKENLVEMGDYVDRGEKLAELNYSELAAQKREAEIGLRAAQIKLRRSEAGGSPGDVEAAEASYEKARDSHRSALEDLEETEKTVNNNIEQAEDRLYNLEDDGSDTVTSHEEAVKSARQNLEDVEETHGEQISNVKDSALSVSKNGISRANTVLDDVDGIINDDDLRDWGVLSAKDSSYLSQTERDYRRSQELLAEAREAQTAAEEENSRENAEALLEKTLTLLRKTADTLDNCYEVLKRSVTSSEFPASRLDSLKATISENITSINSVLDSVQGTKHSFGDSYTTYNTKVAAAQESLEDARAKLTDAVREAEDALETAKVEGEKQVSAAENQVEAAERSLKEAEVQLENTRSPARQEDIELAEAEVEQARASLDLIEEKINNSIITSPIAGEVTKVNFEPGEQVSSQETAIQVTGEQGMKVDVNISEVDIDKIEEGDRVAITFDAFSEQDEFYGEVEFIEPVSTEIQEVVYYETTIGFSDDKNTDIELERVKPGMTADVTIHTAEKDDVLVVPSRAVIEKEDGQEIVRIPDKEGDIREKKVRTGMRGDGGLVEIIEGLEEGEEVVTYIE